MSISAYTGLQGSGKSYEVVSSVIVLALSKGRRVVTNIAGLDYERIVAFILERKLAASRSEIGSIERFEHEDMRLPGFFCTKDDPAGTVQPGDLFVYDEIWAVWGAGETIPKQHTEFLRMHRHLTHPETGVSCDVVIISQHIGDVHRSIKRVVEMTVHMLKLKTLGMAKRYRVNIYSGATDAGSRSSKPDRTQLKKYDAAVFPLYNSYSGSASGQGTEDQVDDRQNIFKGPFFKIAIPLAIFAIGFAFWHTYDFFFSDFASLPSAPSAAVASEASKLALAASSSSAKPVQVVSKGDGLLPGESPTFRLVGTYRINGVTVAQVEDPSGRMRPVVSPESLSSLGPDRWISFEGSRVSPWTGSPPNADNRKLLP